MESQWSNGVMDKATFTSKDRLIRALNHKEPDRVPLDLGSTKVTGITLGAYKKFAALIERAGIRNGRFKSPVLSGLQDVRISDPVQQLVEVPEELLRALQVDTRGVWAQAPFGFKPVTWEDGDAAGFTDEWGINWRMPKDPGLYYDMISHPLSEAASVRDIEGYRWPDPLAEGRLNRLKEAIGNPEFAGKPLVLGGAFAAGFLEMGTRLRGFENFYLDLALNRAMVEALLDKLLELKMLFWESVFKVAGDTLVVAYQSDDYGSQRGLLISPDDYRQLFKPRQDKLFSHIKRLSPSVKIFLHSCGSVRSIIPDFIEVGVDILNPIQTSADGMDIGELKRLFGKDLVFWGGGVDTQKVLPKGSPEEVKDDVRRRIEILAPGGGFVFNTIHNIQADVPPENILAMWEAWSEYGVY